VLLVATFLRRGGDRAGRSPDPAYLVARTRDRRSAAAERAARLITIVQRAAFSAPHCSSPLVRWGWPPRALARRLNSARWPPSYRPAPATSLVVGISAALLAVPPSRPPAGGLD
jgi:hypothetical protein